MSWIFPSVVATLIGTLVLTAIYFYLYKCDRQRFLLIWGIGWLVYGVRFFFMLLVIADTPVHLKPVFLTLNQLCSLGSGLILIIGTYCFTGRTVSRVWYVCTTLVSAWIIGGHFVEVPLFRRTLPLYFLLGLMYVWTGLSILRHSKPSGGGRILTGGAFILWGIHKMDYPFLLPVLWFAPWGYLLGATMEITVSMGMLIIYFNRSRLDLQKSESRFRKLVTLAPLPLAYVDGAGRFRIVNERFTQTFGYTRDDIPTIDDWWTSAYPDTDYRNRVIATWNEKVAEARRENRDIDELEYRVTCNDGTVRDVLISGTVIDDSLLATLKDITEQKKAEAEKRQLEMQLSQAQKMEAVGTLAGGIAHDFNNILGGIIGYADIALDMWSDGDSLKPYLKKIIAASERAKDLVAQILSFSRKRMEIKKVLFLRPVIEEVVGLLQASLPSSIGIVTEFTPETVPVLADPTKIHELVMNLCTNAAHAMEGEGQLYIECGEETVAENVIGRIGTTGPGLYSVVRVRDTGCGIDDETLDRIFEPFFTTKGPGKGTGMGLSVVFGIVKSHQGNILVESSAGKGTVFTVYLPKTTESLTAEKKENTGKITGRESVLLVDDEPNLTEIYSKMLESLGYTVHCFTESDKAIVFFREHHQTVDLVITDLTMPGMNGIGFAREISAIRKNIPLLLCSGNISEVDEIIAGEAGVTGFLMKPLKKDELAKSVREALDG